MIIVGNGKKDKMTITHKIKLIFCRLNWWIAKTEKAKQYKESNKAYEYYLELYNQKLKQYLLEHKQNSTSIITHELNGQVKLLAEILDIKS